jgi:uncharacterized protein YbcI
MTTALGAEARTGAPPDGRTTTAICNALVGALKRVCGKGPTRVKAYAVEDDVVLVVANDALTPVERTLVEGGHAHLVEEARRALAEEVSNDCRATIEVEAGRRVASMLIQVDPPSDSLFATLRFEPLGD